MFEDIKQAAFVDELEKIAAGVSLKGISSSARRGAENLLKGMSEYSGKAKTAIGTKATQAKSALKGVAAGGEARARAAAKALKEFGGKGVTSAAKAKDAAVAAGAKGAAATAAAARAAGAQYNRLPGAARKGIQYGGVGLAGIGAGAFINRDRD